MSDWYPKREQAERMHALLQTGTVARAARGARPWYVAVGTGQAGGSATKREAVAYLAALQAVTVDQLALWPSKCDAPGAFGRRHPRVVCDAISLGLAQVYQPEES